MRLDRKSKLRKLGGRKAESEETPADTEEARCAENEVTSHESHDRG